MDSQWITMIAIAIAIIPNILKGRWRRPLTKSEKSIFGHGFYSNKPSLLNGAARLSLLLGEQRNLLGCEQMSSSCINQLHFEGANLTNVVHAPCSQQHMQWMYELLPSPNTLEESQLVKVKTVANNLESQGIPIILPISETFLPLCPLIFISYYIPTKQLTALTDYNYNSYSYNHYFL